MKKLLIIFILLLLVGCATHEPTLKEIITELSSIVHDLEYFSIIRDGRFLRMEIEHDGHVNLVYETETVKFETIKEFMDWFNN